MQLLLFNDTRQYHLPAVFYVARFAIEGVASVERARLRLPVAAVQEGPAALLSLSWPSLHGA